MLKLTDTFTKCTNLEAIKFNNNQLQSLPDNMVLGLENLNQLFLCTNHFANYLKKPNNLLITTNALDVALDDNQLKVISNRTFSNATTLTFIYIRNNYLSSLPDNLFLNMSNLQN